MRFAFILNPSANKGKARRYLNFLEKNLPPHSKIFLTEGPKHAISIIQKKIPGKFDCIVACGGDGMVSECVRGFMRLTIKERENLSLSHIPLGRGCDFARSLSFPSSLQWFKKLPTMKLRKIDVGSIEYQSEKGEKIKDYFVNVANVGIVAPVVSFSNTLPAVFASASYIYGAVRAIIRYASFSIKKSEPTFSVSSKKILNIVVANGKFFGRGMKVAPQAALDDGLLDVLIVPHLKMKNFLVNLRHIFSGAHTKLEGLVYNQWKSLDLHIDSREILIEADGEVLGCAPVSFKCIPGVLNVLSL